MKTEYEKELTFADLKKFCNQLTDEQLKQPVYFQSEDDVHKVNNFMITDKDHYFDHTDFMGTLEEVKDEFPNTWEEEIKDFTLQPKGTVYLQD